MRRMMSHGGVWAVVRWVGSRPNSRRMAGKSMRFTAGGVRRSSSHTSGNAAAPARIHGDANEMIPRLSIRIARHRLWPVMAWCSAATASCGEWSV